MIFFLTPGGYGGGKEEVREETGILCKVSGEKYKTHASRAPQTKSPQRCQLLLTSSPSEKRPPLDFSKHIKKKKKKKRPSHGIPFCKHRARKNTPPRQISFEKQRASEANGHTHS